MSTPQDRAIVKFLGPGAGVAGPFGLLGINPSDATPKRIEAALQRQLERVDEHAQAYSPEADEVRLALHTAAAQLLDPNVRKELIRRFVGETETTGAAEASAVADAPAVRASAREEAVGFELEDEPVEAVRVRGGAGEREAVVSSVIVGERREEEKASPARGDEFLSRGEWGEYDKPGSYGSSSYGSSSDGSSSDGSSKDGSGKVILLTVAGLVGLVSVVIAVIIATSGKSTPKVAGVKNAGTPVQAAAPPVEQAGSAASDGAASAAASDAASPANTASGAGTAAVATQAETAAKITRASARTTFREVSLVIRSLRALGERARREPGRAAEEFSSVLAPLADWWCDFDLAQRRAAIDAVVEVFFALGGDADAARAASAVLQDWASPLAVKAASATSASPDAALSGVAAVPESVLWRTAFAVGVLTRLGNEGDLPRPAGARVSEALNATLGAGRSVEAVTFDAGAMLALRALSPALAGAGGAGSQGLEIVARTRARVQEYVGACRAVSGDDAAAMERLLIDAAERLLVDGAEPDVDAGVNTAVSELLMAIKWRKDGPARGRLLEWFRDERFTVADLHVATSTLVNKSSAEGVDQTMAVSIGATRDDCVRVRGMIAQAWGMVDAESREEAIVELASAARGALATNQTSRNDHEILASAARAARLCFAARMIWLGDPQYARGQISDTNAVIESAIKGVVPLAAGSSNLSSGSGGQGGAPGTGKLSSGGFGVTNPTPSGAEWAERYLAAERNIPVRLERLAELANMSRPIGKVDAAVLVEQAMFGSPAQIRISAQQWARKFASDPAVLEAILNQLPGAPRTPLVAELVESAALAKLPKISHPQWDLSARRELVARLLATLAGNSPDVAIDALAGVIANAYDDRSAGPAVSNAAAVEDTVTSRALQGVRRAWEHWHAEALQVGANPNAPLRLGEVERRRQTRKSVTSGPVQSCAAEQLSLAELMSVVVAAERPGEAPKVREVINELTRQKRAATHVFEQMAAAERAMLRLWLIRLGREGDA
jgi:trimeric autotransporter adhesin